MSMQMRRIVLGLGLSIVAAPIALADHYIESRQMMTTQTGKTWVSGLKRRLEWPMPFGGSRIVITRVDRGVEWTLDPARRTYTERPLSSPAPGESEMEQECAPRTKPVGGERRIAGFPTKGYELTCERSPEGSVVMWMAAPSGDLAAVERESKAYDEAYERSANPGGSARATASHVKGMAGGMFKGYTDLPKGFPLAVEANDPEGSGRMTIFEVTSVSVAPVDPALFELPQGYAKASASSEAPQAFDAMRRQLRQEAADGASPEGMSEEQMQQMMQGLSEAMQGLGMDEPEDRSAY